jgi:hypothetical protein
MILALITLSKNKTNTFCASWMFYDQKLTRPHHCKCQIQTSYLIPCRHHSWIYIIWSPPHQQRSRIYLGAMKLSKPWWVQWKTSLSQNLMQNKHTHNYCFHLHIHHNHIPITVHHSNCSSMSHCYIASISWEFNTCCCRIKKECLSTGLATNVPQPRIQQDMKHTVLLL